MNIAAITAYQVFDSRGNPTVEAEITLENGVRARAAVPSGASTGQFEALELRDNDPRRFRGKSVFRAIDNIQGPIAAALTAMSVLDQQACDARLIELDATADKSRLGANAILAVSMAAANAAARARGLPLFQSLTNGAGNLLPLPEIQIVGGGAHANWRTDVQDFLLIATGARSFDEVLEITFNVYRAAGEILRASGKFCGLADEGGYWPDVPTNEAAVELVLHAIERAGYIPGKQAALSLDIAASDLYDEKTDSYHFRLENRRFSPQEFTDQIIRWCDTYPIVSIEDPAADTDRESWQRLNQALGRRVQLVGDDLFTTNPARIAAGIRDDLANAVLIKLNQIGTVSETLAAIRMAQEARWNPVISARSGETEDAFISHLAVATNAGQLKVGSFARGERTSKWNEIIRIGRMLGANARFAGPAIFHRPYS